MAPPFFWLTVSVSVAVRIVAFCAPLRVWPVLAISGASITRTIFFLRLYSTTAGPVSDSMSLGTSLRLF